MLYLKKIEYPFIFALGRIIYMLIEIMWRGFTHWSMGICAGVCFVGLYLLEEYYPELNLFIKCFLGALFITFNEFVTGCIVNILLGWNVWDYSKTPFNILGQVCLVFSFLWFLLCIPAFKLAKLLKNNLFSYKLLHNSEKAE